MSHKAAKVGITTCVIVLAFGGLLYTTLGESMEYYKYVDEVMAEPEQWEGRTLQLHGYAADIRRNPQTLDYRFQVQHNDAVVTAYYTGKVPDTFLDDSEVVVKGVLQPDGTFHVHRDGIMAKCPSKYEEQQAGPGVPALGAATY
jgi:cytochrome c-type biogenesis protein CcmE